VPNDALSTVRQPFLGELADKGLDLGFERGGEHPARTFPGDLGQRVLDRSRLTKLETRFGQNIEYTFFFYLLFYNMRTRNDPGSNMICFFLSFYDRGKCTEIFNTTIGATSNEYIIDLLSNHGFFFMEAHIGQ